MKRVLGCLREAWARKETDLDLLFELLFNNKRYFTVEPIGEKKNNTAEYQHVERLLTTR